MFSSFGRINDGSNPLCPCFVECFMCNLSLHSPHFLPIPPVRGSLMWPTVSLSLAPEAAENVARLQYFPSSLGIDGTQYSGGGTQGAGGGSQRPSHGGGDSSITLATLARRVIR